MSIQNKPDYKVFASDAKSGEIETFPDILRGWGVTIDRTGEIPPMEWFNAIGKRVDEWLLYLTQRGIPEWEASLDYPKDAMVSMGGKFYISLKASTGQSPSQSTAAWSELSKFFGIDGKLNKTDVVQSTGASTAQVMSQKAVTDSLGAYATKESLSLAAVPVGATIIWNTSVQIPENFWANEGRSFSAMEYPDAAKVFPDLMLPDDRGYSIRAADNGRGKDPGREVGTYQEDAMQKIYGRIAVAGSKEINNPASYADGAFYIEGDNFVKNGAQETGGLKTPTFNFDSGRLTRTAVETRMKNVAKILITRMK